MKNALNIWQIKKHSVYFPLYTWYTTYYRKTVKIGENIKMSWLTKLERKYGRYAINNITLYLIICYAFGYVIQLFNYGFLDYLTLDPYAILHGQIWRLVTWIIVPPYGFDIFTLVMLYFYYSIGSTLERTWGTFRYNVYLISGMLFTIIGAFLFLLVCWIASPGEAAGGLFGMEMGVAQFSHMAASMFSTYYVCMSIILAFAMTFPDVQVLFMFVIPLKIKVLGIVYALILGYDFLTCVIGIVQNIDSVMWLLYVAKCFAIVFSLLSCILFFVTTRKSFRTPRQIKRAKAYQKQVIHARKISKHKCAICGRTEDEYPDLEFRFCSKCNGNYEYCSEHLFTHKHVE